MYLITLFPSVLLALSLFALQSRYSSFFISVWGALAILVIVSETSFWMHGAVDPISKQSYWANHFYVDQVNSFLKDEKFAIRQGEFASKYSFDIRRSELVLASNTNHCTNCEVTSTGIIDQVPTISANTVVVIYGECAKPEEFMMSVDAYTVCKVS
jgi:hypothetical protein